MIRRDLGIISVILSLVFLANVAQVNGTITQLQDIPKTFLATNETYLLDLTQYFSGFSLSYTLDDATKYAQIVNKMTTLDTVTFNATWEGTLDLQSVHNVEGGAVYLLTKNKTIYIGTNNVDPTKAPTFADGWTFDTDENVTCYDLIQLPAPSTMLYVDCARLIAEPTVEGDWEDLWIILDTTDKEFKATANTPRVLENQTDIPTKRYVKIISYPYIVRYQESADMELDVESQAYLQIWNAQTPVQPDIFKVVTATEFQLERGLYIEDLQVFQTEIFFVERYTGAIRVTKENLLTDQPQYYAITFTGFSLDLLTVYQEIREGLPALLVLVGGGGYIHMYDWSDPRYPNVITTFELGPATLLKLGMTARYVIAHTEVEDTNQTRIQVFDRSSRLYNEIYHVSTFENNASNSFMFFNPQNFQILLIDYGQAHLLELNSSLLLFTQATASQTFQLTVTEPDPIDFLSATTKVVPVPVIVNPNATDVLLTGTISIPSITAFNGDVFKVPMDGIGAGPALNYSVDESKYTVDIDFMDDFTIYLDGSNTSIASADVRWSQWENDGSQYYYFLQNGTNLTAYICQIDDQAASVSCQSHSWSILSGFVTALTMGQTYFAFISKSASVITIVAKSNGVASTIPVTAQGGCADIQFVTFPDADYLFCSVTLTNQILVYVPPAGTYMAAYTTVTGPQTLYTLSALKAILWVKGNGQLLGVQIGSGEVLIRIDSAATHSDIWHVALAETRLAIISASPTSSIEIWDIYNLNKPFFMTYYPTYGLQLRLEAGLKQSYDYSSRSKKLVVSAIDGNLNTYILVYTLGATSPGALYKYIDLNTTKSVDRNFLQTVADSQDWDYIIFNRESTGGDFFAASLQSTPFLQIHRPILTAPNQTVTTDKLVVNISNPWTPTQVVTPPFTVVFYESFDNVTVVASNDIDFNSLINVNAETIPAIFNIPDADIFNGSVISHRLECDRQDECDSGKISLLDHFDLDGQQVNSTSIQFNDVVAGDNGVYSLTKNQVFVFDSVNHSLIQSVVTINIPNSDYSNFTCVKMAMDELQTYLAVTCVNTTTTSGWIALISLTSFKPMFIGYLAGEPLWDVLEVKICDDVLYILNIDNDGDSHVLMYRVETGTDLLEDVFDYFYTIDALKVGVEKLSLSSFDVLVDPTAPAGSYQYLIFLMDSAFGLHVATAYMAHDTFLEYTHFSLYTLLQPYYVTKVNTFQNVDISPIVPVPVNGSNATNITSLSVLVTTLDSNHFDLIYDIAGETFTVSQIYQRYGALQIVNKLQATSSYFVVYAVPEHRYVSIQNRSFLAYDRTLPPTPPTPKNGPVYKNVFAGYQYDTKDYDNLHFDLAEIFDEDANETSHGFFFTAADGQYKWNGFNFRDEVGVLVTSSDIKSRSVDLVAVNDFGEQVITVKLNAETWLRRNLLWIILGVTVVILVAAITIGCRVCNKAASDANKGLLDDP